MKIVTNNNQKTFITRNLQALKETATNLLKRGLPLQKDMKKALSRASKAYPHFKTKSIYGSSGTITQVSYGKAIGYKGTKNQIVHLVRKDMECLGTTWIKYKRTLRFGGAAVQSLITKHRLDGYDVDYLLDLLEQTGNYNFSKATLEYYLGAILELHLPVDSDTPVTSGLDRHHHRKVGTIETGGTAARVPDEKGILMKPKINRRLRNVSISTGLSEEEAWDIYGPNGHNFLENRRSSFIAPHYRETYVNPRIAKLEATIKRLRAENRALRQN